MSLRTRVMGVVALSSMVVSLLVGPASGAAPAPRSSGFLPPSAIPWSSVGQGWLLAQWQPKFTPPPAARRLARHTASYVVLVAPDGRRFLVQSIPSTSTALSSWSGDGRRALLVTQGTAVRLEVLNLVTHAAADEFVLPTSNNVIYESAVFTRPQGLALNVVTQTNEHQLLQRFSLSGAIEATYPAAFSRLGRFTGGFLPSPDGTRMVLGAGHGLAIATNAGVVVRQLALHAESWCLPQRWWSPGVVLASCGSASRLFLFSVAGGPPVAIDRVPVAPDAGDLSAWRLGSAVYVQVASACGYEYLAKLDGKVPVRVKVPKVPLDHTVYVIGVAGSRLALQASVACNPGASLLWYSPSKASSTIVLGPPVTSGTVDTAELFATLNG